ncbi:MAG: NAD(+)/NADH kinase [Patescibacteria group bacterium]
MTIGFFYYPENKKAAAWAKKMQIWMNSKQPSIEFTNEKPKFLIVLGGDGAILEAARKYQGQDVTIVGFNLGHVGFLASVRKSKDFLAGLNNLLKGKYHITKRLMMSAMVERKGKAVFSTNAMNDVVVQSTLSIVELEADIQGYPIQYVRGSGLLVATATGSTGYNLSAHGPIIMPDIECFIITELLDHNIPTPSVVVKRDQEITIKILNFRKPNVVISADGSDPFPLQAGDVIKIRRSPRLVKFAEFEKNYFFKSLQEKFAFR